MASVAYGVMACPAAAQAVVHFTIRGGELKEALRQFSLQSDQDLLFTSDLVAGRHTAGFTGTGGPELALSRLLAGTGLTYRVASSGVLLIEADGRPAVIKAQYTRTDAAPAPVASEPAPAAAPGDTAPEQDIVVTASRVQRGGYTAPTPTTVIGAEQLERRGATNLAEVLSDVPSFKTTTGPQTNGVISRTPGANYLDLRGLGSSRTLVLVDGKRFVPQIAIGTVGYQVDINQIPALLVERTEVVTGGASAQWGSDAVAGVVNIILRKKFDGLRAEAQAGISSRGDNESRRFGAVLGKNFAGDRANLTAAFDYERNLGVGDVYTRDWGRMGYNIIANPVAGATPTNYILPDVQFSRYTSGGLINNTSLAGTEFLPGGATRQFTYGTLVGSTYMAGGSNTGFDQSTGPAISPGVERWSAYVRGSYDVSDALSIYAEGSYAYGKGGGLTLPARDTALVIRQDNAFLPQAIRDRMIAEDIQSFNLGRASYDIAWARSGITNRTARVVAGAEGVISSTGNWKWDTSYTYGHNRYAQRVYNNRIRSRFNLAYDAVVDPLTSNIVCRSTLTDPTNGCVPLNVFGAGSPSAEAAAYVTGTTHANVDYDQHSAELNITGEPFSTWAGPVSLATGVSYRTEKEDAVVDAISQASDYEANNSQPVKGKFNVKEFYAEAVVPLAADTSWARSLDLNGAIRVADYSTSAGTQTPWKLGATYTPVTGVMFRVGRSRDIRAPNIFELNIGPTRTATIISYPPLQPQVFSVSSGNANLRPEKADTLTVGGAWQPSFARGLQFSVDYYRINMKDVISTLSAQQIANFCLAGEQAYCSLITYAGTVPTVINTPYLNLASVKTSGIDGQLSYRSPLDRIFGDGAPGTVSLNFSGNYALHAYVDTGAIGAAVVDRAGETGPTNAYSVPRFRGTASVTYEVGGFSIMAQTRYISSGKYNNSFTAREINNNTVPSRMYLDLSTSYQVNRQFQFFAVANNVFDKAPPPAPSSLGAPTNAAYFDMIGATFRVGVRLAM